MKRLLFLVLALSICVVSSCAPALNSPQSLTETASAETQPISKEATDETVKTTETKEEIQMPVNPEYSEGVLSLKDSPDCYKTFGRTFVTDAGLNVNFAANGFEFEVECGGSISMNYSGLVRTYFQVYVDGAEGQRICTQVGKKSIEIAKNVPDGVHTIRVIRDTDATKAGELMAISEVCFTGKLETLRAPEDKELYIEFVGDSITAGKYTEMQYGEGDAIHKGTNSYAYLTAQNLDADFSVIARGGCGYFRVNTCPKTMNQLYPYYNGFAKEPVAYETERKADVVILALGTNDAEKNVKESYENGTVPFATFDEALLDMISQIRALHGENVPVVLLYGMMSKSWESSFKSAAEMENVYLLKVTTNKAGGNNHPSTEGHIQFAKELTAFLEVTVLK